MLVLSPSRNHRDCDCCGTTHMTCKWFPRNHPGSGVWYSLASGDSQFLICFHKTVWYLQQRRLPNPGRLHTSLGATETVLHSTWWHLLTGLKVISIFEKQKYKKDKILFDNIHSILLFLFLKLLKIL